MGPCLTTLYVIKSLYLIKKHPWGISVLPYAFSLERWEKGEGQFNILLVITSNY